MGSINYFKHFILPPTTDTNAISKPLEARHATQKDFVVLPTRDIFNALMEVILTSEVYEPKLEKIAEQLLAALSIDEGVDDLPGTLGLELFCRKLQNTVFFDPSCAVDVACQMHRCGIQLYGLLKANQLYTRRLLPYQIHDWVGMDIVLKRLKNQDISLET